MNKIIEILTPKCNGVDLPLSLDLEKVAQLLENFVPKEIVNNQSNTKKYLNVKEYVKEEFDVKEEDYLKVNIGYFSAKELTELIEDAIMKVRIK